MIKYENICSANTCSTVFSFFFIKNYISRVFSILFFYNEYNMKSFALLIGKVCIAFHNLTPGAARISGKGYDLLILPHLVKYPHENEMIWPQR